MFGGAKPWAERNVALKPCRACRKEFQPKTGGNLYCDTCAPLKRRAAHAASQRVWRAKDPVRSAATKAKHDLKKFGLTLAQYQSMLTAQQGACAICGTIKPGGRGKFRPLAVDHCHRTGKIRALLCHRCNGALGMVSDNIGVLEKMIQYLTEYL